MQKLDPDNKDTYAANASAYIEKLSALDGAYQSAVDSATRKTVLFGDRFPFRYLVDDYGLSYYAALRAAPPRARPALKPFRSLQRRWTSWDFPAC